jgi:hypothetical protein
MAKKKPFAQDTPSVVLTPWQQEEYVRCMYDIPYFAEKYCKVWVKEKAIFQPFVLFPHQLEVIDAYQTYDNNLILKYRQGGITTTTCLYIAHLLNFTPDVKVAVVANTLTLAQESIFAGVVDIIKNLPDWLRMEPDGKDSQKKKIYKNGAQIQALAAGTDGTRGFSPDLLFLDEAAYLQYGDQFMTSTMGALSAGGRIILNSTPNGQDPVYWAKYNGSIKGENDFNIVKIYWYEDPRFNKDLEWEKKIGDDLHSIPTKDPAVYQKLMQDGYEPTSSWFRAQCAKQDYNPKKIAQEIQGQFIGSGGNLIDAKDITRIKNETVRPPVETNAREDSKFWYWGHEKPGASYYVSVDVAMGTGEDYSTIEVLEEQDGGMEQMAELQCKYPPQILAERVYDTGKKYNWGYVVIDVTGGYGAVVMSELLRLGYPQDRIHMTEIRAKPIRDRLLNHVQMKNGKEVVPGFSIGANRKLILEELERAVRMNELIIRSSRLVNEFETFVWNEAKGRYDHQRSAHDDLLINLAMALYTRNCSFGGQQRGFTFGDALLQAQCWNVLDNSEKDSRQWLYADDPFDVSPEEDKETHAQRQENNRKERERQQKREERQYKADPFGDFDFGRDSPVLPFYY